MGHVDLSKMRLPMVRTAPARNLASEIDGLKELLAAQGKVLTAYENDRLKWGLERRRLRIDLGGLAKRTQYLEARLLQVARESVVGMKTLDELAISAAKLYNIEAGRITDRDRTRYPSKARKVFCAMARDLGYTCREIGNFLNLSVSDTAAVTKLSREGWALLAAWQDADHE